MRAAWYDRQGAAADVFQIGELPDPEPGRGEVRVRLTVSGVNPGDTKKRGGWLGNPMAFPRIIPHSDGAGVVDAVGAGVDRGRMGQRVWVYGAQSYRPFGTAAELVVVPNEQAVQLPANVSDELGACLGIPGITAHRCVFGDGPVTGKVVLVHGILGSVGSMAAQLARWNDATVVGTVRRTDDLAKVDSAVCDSVVALDDPDSVSAIRALVGGVHRVVEVSLSDNVDLDAAVAVDGAVIAAYASGANRPCIPFWPLLFANVSVQMLGSDDFPSLAKKIAVQDLTSAAATGALTQPVSARYPLTDVARSHDHVDAGVHGRVLLAIA
ncbi:MAG: NADPH:quinone reductase [Mycobacterium sp.]|jgi:NADPH2:quinone reductase|nr:NADPH:quinone reductase [Mycobacterium sp.]